MPMGSYALSNRCIAPVLDVRAVSRSTGARWHHWPRPRHRAQPLGGSSCSSCAMEGKRAVKSCPLLAVDDHARAHLMGLHAVAVELHLVSQPSTMGTVLVGIGLQGGMKRSADMAVA